jgi:hypothetical protein
MKLGNQERIITTSVQLAYSIVVLFLPNSSSTLYSYVYGIFEYFIYLDHHDIGGYLEHINLSFMDLMSHQLGVVFNTHTWDPSLRWSMYYFNVVARICTWDLGSLAYFNIMVHTHPWDPGIWLYFLRKNI